MDGVVGDERAPMRVCSLVQSPRITRHRWQIRASRGFTHVTSILRNSTLKALPGPKVALTQDLLAAVLEDASNPGDSAGNLISTASAPQPVRVCCTL